MTLVYSSPVFSFSETSATVVVGDNVVVGCAVVVGGAVVGKHSSGSV